MRLEYDAFSDTGLQREHNEDACAIREPRSPEEEARLGWLLAVADGMGGHLAGEVASKLAIETLLERYGQQAGADPGAALQDAVARANRAVWEAGQSDASRVGMGTTLVAAVIRAGRVLVAHVGDSPAFLIRQGEVQRLTQRDHSWVAEAVERGYLLPEEAESHPYRHVLTRALGSYPDVAADLSEERPLYPEDVVVLCSDGLLRHVRQQELPALVQGRSAHEAAHRLVALANERGGEDNTTVVICRVLP